MLPNGSDLRVFKEELSVDYGVYGYLIKYRGHPIGGHGLSHCGQLYFEAMAEYEMSQLLAGEFGGYEPAIRQIRRMVQ